MPIVLSCLVHVSLHSSVRDLPGRCHSTQISLTSPLLLLHLLFRQSRPDLLAFCIVLCIEAQMQFNTVQKHDKLTSILSISQALLSDSAMRSWSASTRAVSDSRPKPFRLRLVMAKSVSFQPPTPTSPTIRTLPGICG